MVKSSGSDQIHSVNNNTHDMVHFQTHFQALQAHTAFGRVYKTRPKAVCACKAWFILLHKVLYVSYGEPSPLPASLTESLSVVSGCIQYF